MIISFVRYDHYIGVILKKCYFLLETQTEILIIEMIIYLGFALDIPEK